MGGFGASAGVVSERTSSERVRAEVEWRSSPRRREKRVSTGLSGPSRLERSECRRSPERREGGKGSG